MYVIIYHNGFKKSNACSNRKSIAKIGNIMIFSAMFLRYFSKKMANTDIFGVIVCFRLSSINFTGYFYPFV
jgi:hypothetical protein